MSSSSQEQNPAHAQKPANPDDDHPMGEHEEDDLKAELADLQADLKDTGAPGTRNTNINFAGKDNENDPELLPEDPEDADYVQDNEVVEDDDDDDDEDDDEEMK